jgi:YfiH family protein
MPESSPAVTQGFEWRTTPTGRALVCLALEPLAPHLFTTRASSHLPGQVEPDYAGIGAWLQLPEAHVVRVRQVHGRHVYVVSPADQRTAADADALVSCHPERGISVRVADCVPILIADRDRRVVAAVHAGWRGTAAGIAAATIESIRDLGISPSNLVAAIGPSIGPCCYQVDAIVREQFALSHSAAGDWFIPDGGDRWRLDLWQANRAQLEACGVPATAIGSAQACTAHDEANWHSFRRDGATAGRMVAAIRLGRTTSGGYRPAEA